MGARLARVSLDHEAAYWGDCANTWHEEYKQQHYAILMGVNEYGHWPRYDLSCRSVVDIGGGPVSMLLKTVNGGRLTVADPCGYPKWVRDRYRAHDVNYAQMAAEDFAGVGYDEAWIYNVLQHVRDPERVAAVAGRAARTARVFEWTGIPADDMHPHVLTPEALDEWFGCEGTRTFGVNQAWGEAGAWSWSAVRRL
jgi:hypothetical protein